MKVKKILALLLVAAMMLVLVAACAEEDVIDAPPDDLAPAPAPADPTPAPADDLELADPDAIPDDLGGTFSNITTQVPVVPLDASPTRDNTLIVGYNVLFTGEAIAGFSNMSYDITIRNLLHGDVGTVAVDPAGELFVNEKVVDRVWRVDDSAGNRTYTFQIAEGFTWSDGTAITAFDFVSNVLWTASPQWVFEAGAVLHSSTFRELVGWADYAAPLMIQEDPDWEAPEDDEDATPPMMVNPDRVEHFRGVRLLNDMTFSLTISADELPYFFELILVSVSPIPAHVYLPGVDIITDENGSRFSTDILDMTLAVAAPGGERFNPTVVAGPYTWVSNADGVVTVARNPMHGGNALGLFPSIDFIQQTDAPSAVDVDMLFAGEVDLLPQHLTADKIERVIANPDFAIHDFIRWGYGVVNFQHWENDHLPISDLNVRLAFAHVIDRQAVLDQVLAGRGSLIDTMASPGQWMWQAAGAEALARMTPYTFSIELAHDRLDETQWIFESDGVTPFDREKANAQGTYLRHNSDGEVLWVRNAAASQDVGDAIEIETVPNAAMAGMRFTSEFVDWGAVISPNVNAPWTLTEEERVFSTFSMGTGFTSAVFDPWWLESEFYRSPSTIGWQDPVMDEYIIAMRRTEGGDYEAFASAWVNFVVRHNQMVVSLPLYNNIWADLYNPRIQGMGVITDLANWANPASIVHLSIG